MKQFPAAKVVTSDTTNRLAEDDIVPSIVEPTRSRKSRNARRNLKNHQRLQQLENENEELRAKIAQLQEEVEVLLGISAE